MVFCSTIPDYQAIKAHVEQDFRKDCEQILVKYELEDQESEIIEFEKEQKSPETSEQEPNKQSDISGDFEEHNFSEDANDSKPTCIGNVIFDKKHQFLRTSSNNDTLYG